MKLMVGKSSDFVSGDLLRQLKAMPDYREMQDMNTYDDIEYLLDALMAGLGHKSDMEIDILEIMQREHRVRQWLERIKTTHAAMTANSKPTGGVL